VYLFLGIHHPLMWYGVLQNNRRWLLQTLLWGPLRGKWRRRMSCVHGFFHSFEVRNLGAMVCIISILAIESTREVSLEVIVPPLSRLIVIVDPIGRVLLGVISSWSRVVIVLVFPFLLGIIHRMGCIFHIQLFKSLKVLNGRGLNKVNVGLWLS
jgi:hypothetical protein